jgi:hypothetical protein
MRNLPTTFALVFLVTTAANATGVAASPSPIDHHQILELITQLGSPQFKEREKAMHALEAIGGPALDALQRAALSNDPEIGRRAQNLVRAVRRQIDTARFLAPLRLRLVYRQTPVLQAVEDFAAKTGFPITVAGSRAHLAGRKITLDTGETSFWDALEQFCQKAGLQERLAGLESERPDATLVIRPLNGAMRMIDVSGSNLGAARAWDGQVALVDGRSPPRPTYHAGTVRIRAVPAKGVVPDTQGSECAFLIEITPQPKSAWQHLIELRIDKALDSLGHDVAPLLDTKSDGNQLTPAGRVAMLWDAQTGQPLTTCRDVPVRLKGEEKPTGILKEVHGVVVAQVQTEPQAIITVDNIFQTVGRAVVSDDGDSLKVTEADHQPKDEVHLTVELIDASSPNPLWVMRGGVMRPNRFFRRGVAMGESSLPPVHLVLLDADGRNLPLRNRNEDLVINGTALARVFTLTYHCGVSEPHKLIYSRRRTIMIEIPFTLHDVPLP